MRFTIHKQERPFLFGFTYVLAERHLALWLHFATKCLQLDVVL